MDFINELSDLGRWEKINRKEKNNDKEDLRGRRI